jgi:ribonuclease P/MRP protein subunit RPP1
MEKYILIKEETFEKAKNKIDKNLDKSIIFSSEDDDLNTKVLEKLNINTFLLNQGNRKDQMKQRNSGFNQVLAKLAKKNKVIIGINLDEIIESNGIKKSEILARIKQNIKLCNKNKLKMKFISMKEENQRNIYDLKALGIVLGMPTTMIKNL